MILLFIVLLVLPQDRLRGAVTLRTRERFSLPSMTNTYVAAVAFVVVDLLLSRIMAPVAALTLSDAIAAAIIILSLVLLVGYAGEVSLATMALAGHRRHRAVPPRRARRVEPGRESMAFVIAIVATALVGAVIALPALRLRGLYLALATAAFSLARRADGVQGVHRRSAASIPATLILLVVLGARRGLPRRSGRTARGAR